MTSGQNVPRPWFQQLIPEPPVIHPQCKHALELANDEKDTYCSRNGGRGISGQIDVPPPPTEPEITTF